jgi:hypothetical protein
MILDMIQGCRYLQRSTDRWFPSKNSTTRLKDSRIWRKPICCEIIRYPLHTSRACIYTLVLTRLLVDYEYNIKMSKLMFRRQCPSRIRHQLVLSLHQATPPCVPENFSFKSANGLLAEWWRIADRKRPLPIPLRRLFPAEWYLPPSSAHKSAFLLYHFLVLTYAPSITG